MQTTTQVKPGAKVEASSWFVWGFVFLVISGAVLAGAIILDVNAKEERIMSNPVGFDSGSNRIWNNTASDIVAINEPIVFSNESARYFVELDDPFSDVFCSAGLLVGFVAVVLFLRGIAFEWSKQKRAASWDEPARWKVRKIIEQKGEFCNSMLLCICDFETFDSLHGAVSYYWHRIRGKQVPGVWSMHQGNIGPGNAIAVPKSLGVQVGDTLEIRTEIRKSGSIPVQVKKDQSEGIIS